MTPNHAFERAAASALVVEIITTAPIAQRTAAK
jgi:hypothetical protein